MVALCALSAACAEERGATEETRAIREEMRALEAIGYADGTVAAEEDRAEGVTVHDTDRARAGWNLMVSGHGPEAVLLDMGGDVVHTWRRAFAEIWPERADVKGSKGAFRRARLEPNGDLYAIFEGLGLVKLDADSNVLWAYDGLAHHDLDVAPDGRVFVLTRKSALLPRLAPEGPVLEDFVTVLDPQGRPLEAISLIECFERSGVEAALEAVRAGGDVFHTNTLQVLDGRHAGVLEAFAAGNLLVSVRNLDLVAVVDPRTRTVPWTLAGPWRRQHEPVLLADGNLLLFDNLGAGRRSRVLEVDPRTGATAWSYEGDGFFTRLCGTSQRLPGGNTLITESGAGRAFEVTPDGEIVWEFHTPYRGGEEDELVATLFEMIRLPPDHTNAWLE